MLPPFPKPIQHFETSRYAEGWKRVSHNIIRRLMLKLFALLRKMDVLRSQGSLGERATIFLSRVTLGCPALMMSFDLLFFILARCLGV